MSLTTHSIMARVDNLKKSNKSYLVCNISSQFAASIWEVSYINVSCSVEVMDQTQFFNQRQISKKSNQKELSSLFMTHRLDMMHSSV